MLNAPTSEKCTQCGLEEFLYDESTLVMKFYGECEKPDVKNIDVSLLLFFFNFM